MMVHRLVEERQIEVDDSALAIYSVDYPAGTELASHRHNRDQLVFATDGTMRVQVPDAVWLVLSQHAVLIPADTPHEIKMVGPVAMRTLYARTGLLGATFAACRVLLVSPLLRADRRPLR